MDEPSRDLPRGPARWPGHCAITSHLSGSIVVEWRYSYHGYVLK